MNKANGHPVVLVVEDHLEVRRALCDYIEALFSGLRVLESGSGESALQLVASEQPQVVLMDACAVDTSGIEATQRIAQCAPDCSIVLVSVETCEDHRAAALAAGATELMTRRELPAGLAPLLGRLIPSAGRTLTGRRGGGL